jgi:hypothetical protein
MNFPHPLDHAVHYVYGEPFQTPDGATVITAAKVRRRRNRRTGAGDPNVIAVPMGCLSSAVSRRAGWRPSTRIGWR